MGIGIALGNTVDSVGPALQRGEFVGVSIPIGMSLSISLYCSYADFTTKQSVSLL
jgi:ACR3 family arsenite transporter